ncbi:MAG: cache domain-containing protein [Candidatus Thiodiazotropha sp.]
MQISDRPSNPTLMPMIRLTLLIALPLLLLVNGVIWSVFALDSTRQRQAWISQAEADIDASILIVEQLRNDLFGDIRLLSNSPNLLAVLDDASDPRLLALTAEWEIFASIKRRYDQIRWLDARGRERLRVNLTSNGAIRVSEESLQDKSSRYYFHDAMALNPGQVYASRIDLNMENGVIERPFKPMLRLAMALSDSHGRPRGLLVINVLAKYLIDAVVSQGSLRHSRMLLLDRSGYYLRGFEPEQAWGFMLHHADDAYHRFDKAYPEVWRRMVRDGSGRVDDAEGLFVYRTIRYGSSEGIGHRYILVQALTASERSALTRRQRSTWRLVSLAVSLALAAMAFALARCRLSRQTA